MFDFPPPDPGIEISIASQGMSKGLLQSEGPQFIPRAYAQLGEFQLGGQWKNVTSPVAEGEGAAFATWQRKLGALQLSAGATFKFQTDVTEPTDDKALELNGSVSRKWGKFGLRVGAVYSPDDFGSARQSLYVEGGPLFDVTKTLRISASIGRRERNGSPDYTSFNAGISKTAGPMVFDARFYDTAQSDLGKPYRRRLVVSARLSF